MTRDALISALSAAIPGSQDFSQRNAERVVEALEALINETRIDNAGDLLKSLEGFNPRRLAPEIYRILFPPKRDDPDVRELLDAIEDHFQYSSTPMRFEYAGSIGRLAAKYKAVRAKYE